MNNNELFTYLLDEYGPTLNKKEVAKVIKCGVSTLDYYIARNYKLPEYIKMGEGKNSKVIFPVQKVVDFLENTTKVL